MSSFGSLGTARLGIYAAQKGLDVTGNNITNINTQGYTRQRLDQVSLVTGSSDKYFSSARVKVGQGVLVSGISQIRDPGLDLSYRAAQSNVGAADAKLAGLEQLATILDEVGKGGIDGQKDGVILDQLNDLRDLISKATAEGIDGYDTLIRASAKSLCILFNKYATELSELKGRYETYLNQDVNKVNDLLAGIQELNETIRNSDIRGDPALELRDQRNNMLDELSKYMKVDVKYSLEDVGNGLMVEKLNVSLATGNKDTLIDGVYATRVGLEQEDNPNYDLTLAPLTKKDGTPLDPDNMDPVNLGDTDLYGSIQSLRELLTEKGEYSVQADVDRDPNATVKRGIPFYQNALDNLARQFATEMNALNTAEGVDKQGNLFSNSSVGDDAANITAANISISKGWAEGTVGMIRSRDPSASSGDNTNLGAFLDLFRKNITFNPGDLVEGAVGAPYEGSFEDMLLRSESILAEDQMTTTKTLQNYVYTSNQVYTQRDGVSGVDLNDEATNLMVFQKAYTASCRLMTVINEALDSLLAIK